MGMSVCSDVLIGVTLNSASSHDIIGCSRIISVRCESPTFPNLLLIMFRTDEYNQLGPCICVTWYCTQN